MSGKLVNEQYLYDIANAIRRKNGKTTLYRPQDMDDAILDLASSEDALEQLISTKTITNIYVTGITSVRNFAFKNYTTLNSVNFPDVLSIGESAFEECSSLTSVTLPSCTSIGITSFKNCSSLTTIDLPSVTTIGNYAFDNCDNLSTINLPACTSIDYNAFSGCDALTTIELPSVTTIGNQAFYSCSNLTSVILSGSTRCTLTNEYVFYYTPIQSGTGYIYVPANLVNSYKSDAYWVAYANQIVAIPSE